MTYGTLNNANTALDYFIKHIVLIEEYKPHTREITHISERISQGEKELIKIPLWKSLLLIQCSVYSVIRGDTKDTVVCIILVATALSGISILADYINGGN